MTWGGTGSPEGLFRCPVASKVEPEGEPKPPFLPPKTYPKIHSLKAPEDGAKREPNGIIVSSSVSCRFFPSFLEGFLIVFPGAQPSI